MGKLTLPKSLLELPAKDRDEIVAVLVEASKLPKTRTLSTKHAGDEHNMWARNGDPLLGEAEDTLYADLLEAEAENMAKVFLELGLPVKGLDLKKSFGEDFIAFEEELLLKSKDNGRNRMSKWIDKLAGENRARVKKWAEDGKALTRQELKKLDDLLSTKLPDYAKKAEDFMIRAGFIGKARRKGDQEDLNLLGAVIDRFPASIQASRDEGVVLTVRHKEKMEAAGHKVKVLPLTKRESEAIEHAALAAGDKMTEISERHRTGVRQLVIQAKRERWSAAQLAQKLFDKFGEHNRDWRRVAITELAFAHNDAFLAGCEEGATVIGMGALDACPHCKRLIIGKTFTVTHKVPKKENYKTDMDLVWVGKSNYGRRVPEYRAAVPLHPNCRCRYHVISRFYKVGDNGKLVLKSTAELIQEEREKRGMAPDPNLATASGRALTQEELSKKADEVLRKLEGGY